MNIVDRVLTLELRYEVFRGRGCLTCREADPVCLVAHHVDPTFKEFDLGSYAGSRPTIEEYDEELTKCVCLCRNCHAKVHAGTLDLPFVEVGQPPFRTSYHSRKQMEQEARSRRLALARQQRGRPPARFVVKSVDGTTDLGEGLRVFCAEHGLSYRSILNASRFGPVRRGDLEFVRISAVGTRSRGAI